MQFILLSVAQLTTIAVCVSGFAISLKEILPHYSLTSIELCTILALAIVSSFPVDFALKTQGLIYIIVLSAIVSVFMGSGSQIPADVTPLPSLTALSFWPAPIEAIELRMLIVCPKSLVDGDVVSKRFRSMSEALSKGGWECTSPV